MTAIVNHSNPATPTPIPIKLDRVVRSLASKLVPAGLGHEISAADAPSAEARDYMARRVAALGHWLVPAPADWITKQLAALAVVRPPQGDDVKERKAALLAYVQTLGSLPAFALDRAFHGAHRGEVGKPAFMPTPAELHRAAVRHVEPLVAERRKIESVLAARVVTARSDAATRKAVADRARAVMREQVAHD